MLIMQRIPPALVDTTGILKQKTPKSTRHIIYIRAIKKYVGLVIELVILSGATSPRILRFEA